MFKLWTSVDRSTLEMYSKQDEFVTRSVNFYVHIPLLLLSRHHST